MSSLLSLQQGKELIIQLIISLLKERAFYVRVSIDAICLPVGADRIREFVKKPFADAIRSYNLLFLNTFQPPARFL